LVLLYVAIYPQKIQPTFKVKVQDGDIFFGYLVLYSVGRFMIEFLRTDSLYLVGDPINGGIRSAQAVALLSLFIGVGGLLYRHRTQPKIESGNLTVGLRSKK
jgi:prolipoprotein diacylglyceryltransferase